MIKKRGIYILPNLFTVSCLFAGFYAIIASIHRLYDYAAIALFIAALMDGLDGRVARLTNTTSAFGAEFDSLVDVISFGLAPSILVYNWSLFFFGKIGWLIAFFYTVSTALRLARFNTQLSKTVDKRYFQGLPCPAAACILAGLVWCGYNLINPDKFKIIISFFPVIAAIFMVSNIRYRSFKDADLKNNIPFVFVLIIVFFIVFVSIDPSKVLFILCFGYLISGPVATILAINKKKKQRREYMKKNILS